MISRFCAELPSAAATPAALPWGPSMLRTSLVALACLHLSSVAHAQDAATTEAAAIAAPAPTAGATAHIESVRPMVTVAMVTGRGTGVATGAGGTATASFMDYKDVCMTPCDVPLDPGLRELVFYGDGHVPVTFKWDYKPGTTGIQVDTGKAGPRMAGMLLFSVGLTAALGGSIGFMLDGDYSTPEKELPSYTLPLLGLGALGAGGGVALMMANRSSATVVSNP